MPHDIVDAALVYAAQQHSRAIESGRFRWDKKTPYIVHPIRVWRIVTREFGIQNTDAQCIAILHDTMEDTGASYEDIEEKFGRVVANGVSLLTKDLRIPKETRLDLYFTALMHAAMNGNIFPTVIKIADAVDNFRDSTSIKRAVEKANIVLDRLVPAYSREINSWKMAHALLYKETGDALKARDT